MRTPFIRILSPFLFYFPDVHLRELEKLWTDKIIVEALWREFMQKLVSEWTEFVLYVCPGVLLWAQTTRVLSLMHPTVNGDARCKCRVSCHSRRCYRPSERNVDIESVDQSLPGSDYKFHLVGV